MQQVDLLSNVYDFLVQKCEINGLDIDEMRRESGISRQVFNNWRKGDPKTLKLLKVFIDTIDGIASIERDKHAIDCPLFAGHEIRTYSGLYINVFDPKPDMFVVGDIAMALSRKARFGGHTRRFLSVAEHSVRVALLCSPINQKAALLHDASEAYLSDIPSPIKALMTEYKRIEHGVMVCIAEKFGFKYPLDIEVKYADNFMLDIEWQRFMLNDNLTWSMDYANSRFYEMYKDIFLVN